MILTTSDEGEITRMAPGVEPESRGISDKYLSPTCEDMEN